MAVIELKKINKIFGSGISRVHVLHDIDFSANRGQLILVVGPSGSGKSTFLTIAGGLQTPTSGSVEVEGKAVEQLTKAQRDKLRLNQIGFVLQSYNLVPYLKVKEQFEFVDKVKRQGNLNKEDLAGLLKQLGISNLVDKFQVSCREVKRNGWRLPERCMPTRILCWRMNQRRRWTVKRLKR